MFLFDCGFLWERSRNSVLIAKETGNNGRYLTDRIRPYRPFVSSIGSSFSFSFYSSFLSCEFPSVLLLFSFLWNLWVQTTFFFCFSCGNIYTKMRLQLNSLFQGISFLDFLWSLNVGQTNDNFYIFKTFGSDGTLVDALCEKPLFNLQYKIVANSPLTEAPAETLTDRALGN